VRIRDILAALLGLAVVAAIGYGAWSWLSDSVLDAEEPRAQPGADPWATAEVYLSAWEEGDHLAMVRHVREAPEDFIARHVQMRDALRPTNVSIDAGEDTSAQDGRAIYPLTVTLDLDYAEEPLSWDSELELIRERGEWGVVWDLTTIHPELRASWEFATEEESVDRQDILAADGTILSGERTLITFGFRPDSVEDADEIVEAFAEAFPGSEARAERELNRGDLVDDWFYPIVTTSEAGAADARPILAGLPGVLRQTDTGRGLYDHSFAQHVVGVMSEATAEQLEQRELPPNTRIDIGQYGLERDMEDQLLGSDIVRVGFRERDAAGDAPLRVVLVETQADPSAPVETTLEIAVQQAIENALFGVSDNVGFVAIDAESGAILGSASRPLGGYNRAFEGRYAPGSTFKTVTLEALLASGSSPDDPHACPAETTVGGLRITNAGDTGHGTVDLREAFARSCNTTFAELAARLGNDALIDAAERFGFNTEWSLPLSSFGGSFPEPQDTAELGAASFGQARVEASVVHMASVAAAAVTGQWHAPYLLQGDGPHEPRPLSDGAAEPLREMLRAVVTDGTGTEADVDGREVLGKTGTAELGGGVEHAWFIGYYDGVAFAVLVEEGGAGSQVAAPLAGRFVRELASLRTAADRPDADADEEAEEDDIEEVTPADELPTEETDGEEAGEEEGGG
jgi:cell division protein FtsI/penicillin-binding protein 2